MENDTKIIERKLKDVSDPLSEENEESCSPADSKRSENTEFENSPNKHEETEQ